jgi:hypothetical protein
MLSQSVYVAAALFASKLNSTFLTISLYVVSVSLNFMEFRIIPLFCKDEHSRKRILSELVFPSGIKYFCKADSSTPATEA